MPKKGEVLCSAATLRSKAELQLLLISEIFIRQNVTFSQRYDFTLIFDYCVLIIIISLNVVAVKTINFVVQDTQICVKIAPFYNAGAVERKTSRQMYLKGLNWLHRLKSKYKSILPKRGPGVVKNQTVKGHWKTLLFTLTFAVFVVMEALPATFSQSTKQFWPASKTPIKTQQWSEQTQSRHCSNGSIWLVLC